MSYAKNAVQKKRINTKGQTYFVNPMVKGLHFANKALTPEEFKRIAEQIRRHGLQMIDEEAPYFVKKLEDRYPAIKSELQRVFSPYTISEADYIGSSLKRVLDYDNEGSYQMRDRELDTLEFFLRNLKDIETHNKVMFEMFKQKVINVLSKGDFFGVRLEIITCSTFIRNQLNFKPIPESPSASTADFVIHNNNDILIECASTHLEEKRQEIIDEFHKVFLRFYIRESFELIKDYCKVSAQIDLLKNQPWYHFARLVRNCMAHNFKWVFNEGDKKLLPVSLRGSTITADMEGKDLRLEFFNHTHAWNLHTDMSLFVKNVLK